MSYDYVRRAYGVDPQIGQRVQHTVTKARGVIAREDETHGHYVQVLFDGKGFALPCHPTELVYQLERLSEGSTGASA